MEDKPQLPEIPSTNESQEVYIDYMDGYDLYTYFVSLHKYIETIEERIRKLEKAGTEKD